MRPVADWSTMPLGLVSKPYLSHVTGISAATIAKAMMVRRITCSLSKFEAVHCGEAAFAFGPWVEAWGRDRVLAWLDEYDAEGARVLREGIGATEADVRAEVHGRRLHRTRSWIARLPPEERRRLNDRAVELKRAKRGPSRRQVRMAEQEAILATMPVGLLPVLTVSKAAQTSIKAIERHMAAHGIPPYSDTKNSGFPNFPGSWDKLVSAWGETRARAWVATHTPQWVAKFDARNSTGVLPAQYAETLRSAPLGCVPDGVISVAYGVPVYQVSRIRGQRGIDRLRGGTDGAFPHRPGSFARLVERLGHDRARLWVAGYAPKYLEAFDLDTAPKRAATTAPAPVAAGETSSRPSATGAVSPRRGEALRQKMAGQVAAIQAQKTSIERDAAAMRRTPAPERNTSSVLVTRVETYEEWVARGGRVTKLVGAGQPNLGQVQA